MTPKINNNPPTIYLSGAIENLKDINSDWRIEVEKKLRTLGYYTINPIDLADDFEEVTGFERKDMAGLKKSNIYKLMGGFKKIIARDLRAVSQSDFVLAYWDKAAAAGAGTAGEITYAFNKKIPVYLVAKIRPEHIPVWILGCSSGVFNSVIDALTFFKEQASEMGLRRHMPDVE